MRCDPAEKTWAQQDTGDHFPHHQRLLQFGDEDAKDAAERENQSDLQEENQELGAVHLVRNYTEDMPGSPAAPVWYKMSHGKACRRKAIALSGEAHPAGAASSGR